MNHRAESTAIRFARQVPIVIFFLLTGPLLFAEEFVYDFLAYGAPRTETWTVSRKTTGDEVLITFDAEVVFYLFGRISYAYTGWGRYDRQGNLVDAETTIEANGRRQTVSVETSSTTASSDRTDRPDGAESDNDAPRPPPAQSAPRDLASTPPPITAEKALEMAIAVLNPAAVQRRVVPGTKTPFPGLDIAHGRLYRTELTNREVYSPLLERRVLRAASNTTTILFDPDTLILLYATTSDIGLGAELVLRGVELHRR